MKKAMIILLSLACAALLWAPGHGGFSGARVADESRFLLDFQLLDGQEEARMTLHAGEWILLDAACTRGHMRFSIVSPGGSVLYAGTEQSPAPSSLLQVAEEGPHTITITGRNAAGHVHLYRQAGNGAPQERTESP